MEFINFLKIVGGMFLLYIVVKIIEDNYSFKYDRKPKQQESPKEKRGGICEIRQDDETN